MYRFRTSGHRIAYLIFLEMTCASAFLFQIHMSNCQRNETREDEGAWAATDVDHVGYGHPQHLPAPPHNNNNNEGEECESKLSFHQNQSRIERNQPDQPSHTLSRAHHRIQTQGHHSPARSDHGDEAEVETQEACSMADARKLLRIFLYPIKSCAPFEVRWKNLIRAGKATILLLTLTRLLLYFPSISISLPALSVRYKSQNNGQVV